ncbi:peptidylprolyl isomerase [Acidovorax sp. NCPPB 4044]|uniref:peptidylprolyl isomerase n=1 Tax=Acidovorax sp. NCPPB 4044 TaxID=2940490 RepID=UPI002302C524|nr:peptidylprolyl isomerase [Acidovorax sp. NCPPB 4044]MDA8522714.1 peptidylprolyl isomerase [Acidovorax sp. NCPPB 4044]
MSCTCQDASQSSGCCGSGASLDSGFESGPEPVFGTGPGSPAPAVEGPVASVNGIALHRATDVPDADTLRQRACTELLRQAAQRAGLLPADDLPADDGTTSETATQAIEALLEQALTVPEPSDEACRRHYDAHTGRYRDGERVHLRHVLYAVTPGVDVQRLRGHAEATLLQLRCANDGGGSFARAARESSNCPTGAQGGDLGWLGREDCAPEFAREVFGAQEVGVLPRLVHSRFGLHVVEVVARDAGRQRGFGEVRAAVGLALRQQAWVNALRQYLQVLAGDAVLEGVELDGAAAPLVQ